MLSADIKKQIGLVVMLCMMLFFIPLPSHMQQQSIDITLVWSANTYVPPTYPGKPLPVHGSTIEVTANCEPQIDPNTVIYNWLLDDESTLAGVGQTVFRFRLSEGITKNYTIRLELRTLNNVPIASSNYIILRPQSPEVMVEADSRVISQNKTVQFVARPLFFNIDQPDKLNYDWTLDNVSPKQKTGDQQNVFTLKVGEVAETISKTLRVNASNPMKPLQKASTDFLIYFTP